MLARKIFTQQRKNHAANRCLTQCPTAWESGLCWNVLGAAKINDCIPHLLPSCAVMSCLLSMLRENAMDSEKRIGCITSVLPVVVVSRCFTPQVFPPTTGLHWLMSIWRGLHWLMRSQS